MAGVGVWAGERGRGERGEKEAEGRRRERAVGSCLHIERKGETGSILLRRYTGLGWRFMIPWLKKGWGETTIAGIGSL